MTIPTHASSTIADPFADVDLTERDLTEFDLLNLDAETLVNPYPFFKAMREREPVFREPHYGVYLVSRHEDIVSVARRPEVFSSLLHAMGPLAKLPERAEGESVSDQIRKYTEQVGQPSLVNMDPPQHRPYRLLVNKLFSPKRIEGIEQYIERLADGLIDEFVDQKEVEFIDAFAGPIPFLVVADLLGVPREDHDEFKRQLRGEEFSLGNPSAKHVATRVRVREQGAQAGGVTTGLMGYIHDYFVRYITERREAPKDDLMSQLATATFPDSDEQPTIEQVVALALVFFGAGQETTVRLFTTGMQILLERPEIWEELRADGELIPNFVEECLRFDTPVKGLFRLAREDAEIGAVRVPAGSHVLMLWGSGNRDAKRFPKNPEEFDLHRDDAYRNMSFGEGIHFCPGAPLARLEAIIAWKVFFKRIKAVRAADPAEAYSYLPSFIIRGLSQLHLEIERA